MRDEAPIGECVLSAEQIRSGVAKVAALLNDAYDEAVVVTVVPGGILFTADLVRQLEFELSMDYISCPHTPGAPQPVTDRLPPQHRHHRP